MNDPFRPLQNNVTWRGWCWDFRFWPLCRSVFRFLYWKTSVFRFCWPLRFPVFRFCSTRFFWQKWSRLDSSLGLCAVQMLGAFICFYFTVNPGQIAMWDSGFLIEVYSRLCHALGQCRWAKTANEKRKKNGSSENVSERKTAGREKGRACGIFLNTSICPLPRPPRVNMSYCQNLQGRIRASSQAKILSKVAF